MVPASLVIKEIVVFKVNCLIQTNNYKRTETEKALEQVLNSLSIELRGKEYMKIKIIKRADSEKIMKKIPVAENNPSAKTDVREATEQVKLWINDLRQKRERERLSFHELFVKEQCA